MLTQQLHLSPTVERTREKLVNQTAVYPVEVVQSILEQHYDYAANMPRPSLAHTDKSVQRPIDEWLTEVRSLFDSSLAPELHGRLVIIGQSMLEPTLKPSFE